MTWVPVQQPYLGRVNVNNNVQVHVVGRLDNSFISVLYPSQWRVPLHWPLPSSLWPGSSPQSIVPFAYYCHNPSYLCSAAVWILDAADPVPCFQRAGTPRGGHKTSRRPDSLPQEPPICKCLQLQPYNGISLVYKRMELLAALWLNWKVRMIKGGECRPSTYIFFKIRN